jgi:hypothetical protein
MRARLDRSGPFLGIGGLAVAAFLYGYTAIVTPGLLNSVGLPLVWLVLFVLGCAWFPAHPYRLLCLPVVAIALWFVVVLGLSPRG